MNLSDLLVTYNQVRTPESSEAYELQEDFHSGERYIQPPQQTKEKPSDVEDESYSGWQGWHLGNSNNQWVVSPPPQRTRQGNTNPSDRPVTSEDGVVRPAAAARAKRVNNGDNYNKFITAYNRYLSNNPQYAKYKDILISIAGLESAYKQDVANKISSALGWFQFVDSTRANYTKASRQEFASNPDIQFDVASRHIDDIMKQVSPYKNRAKELGLTDLQLVYGMWWRPKSMINYLKTGSDDYVNPGDNATLQKILKYAS